MRYIKWTFLAALLLLAGGFLHYTLPRHDVVRIVETEVRRVEIPTGSLFWNSAESVGTSTNRDVKFVGTIRENGRPLVYRNEDTGWGWPPYWKFNSSDMQARASDLISPAATPQWVQIKRYGWRNQFFSIYPNVLSMKEVASPDVRIIPWFNIVVLSGLAIALYLIRRLWKRFMRNRVDPVVADVAQAFDSVDDKADAAAVKFRGKRMKFREWLTETFGL